MNPPKVWTFKTWNAPKGPSSTPVSYIYNTIKNEIAWDENISSMPKKGLQIQQLDKPEYMNATTVNKRKDREFTKKIKSLLGMIFPSLK